MATATNPIPVHQDRWRVGRHRRLLVVKERVGGKDTGRYFFWFKCPACRTMHAFAWPDWDFDGNFQAPTFSPRLAANPSCVAWLQAGMLTFSSASKHHMVGKVVQLPTLGEDDCPGLVGIRSLP